MVRIERIPKPAQDVIERYLKLPFGQGVATPYFNNRRSAVRAALRATIGKGSPEEIVDEAEIAARREHITSANLDATALKRFLVDHHLGVDCSGFAYHVLKPLFDSRPERSQFLISDGSFIRKCIALLRPAENANVRTFASDQNSRSLTVAEVRAGDIIIRLTPATDRKTIDHMMIVENVERDEIGMPTTINYIHSTAWHADGLYNHGVRRGSIQVTHPHNPITDQIWTEQGVTGDANESYVKAEAAETTLRRLVSFQAHP